MKAKKAKQRAKAIAQMAKDLRRGVPRNEAMARARSAGAFWTDIANHLGIDAKTAADAVRYWSDPAYRVKKNISKYRRRKARLRDPAYRAHRKAIVKERDWKKHAIDIVERIRRRAEREQRKELAAVRREVRKQKAELRGYDKERRRMLRLPPPGTKERHDHDRNRERGRRRGHRAVINALRELGWLKGYEIQLS